MSTVPLHPEELDLFEGFRGRLEAMAYRLLGSATEAEDLVQETFLRWQGADRSQVRVPHAWLTRVLTNLCLNHLTSARARREVYVGQWLPEPVLEGDPMLGPAETAEQRESLSTAVLVLLERLTPQQRAVYVLREAFDLPHAEIAEMLDLSEAASQQILHRARQQVDAGRTRADVARESAREADRLPARQADRQSAREVVEEFVAAATSGQIEPLVQLLRQDAMGVGDGGGTIPARAKPIIGASAVAQFLRGLFHPSPAKQALVGDELYLYGSTANGSPAVLAVSSGKVVGVMVLERTAAGISAVLTQVNPDKLSRANRQWAAMEHGEPLTRVW